MPFRGITQSRTDLTDAEVNILRGVDINFIAPDVPSDLIAGDDLWSALDQKFQDFKGLPLELDSDASK